MRFARHARIFRGPLDAAPVAGVFFLLAFFILLRTLVYTPGALVRLAPGSPAPTDSEILRITGSNTLVYRGVITNADQTHESLRLRPIRNIALQVDPGASRKLVEDVNSWFEIHPPDGNASMLTGVGNSVIVKVNFRGQCFFENQELEDEPLKAALKRRLDDELRQGKDLTVALVIDKNAPIEVFLRLRNLAQAAGFKWAELAENPNP